MFRLNPMLATDFYKPIHRWVYVPGLEFLTSYWTPRKSRVEGVDKVVAADIHGVVMEMVEDFEENFFKMPWAVIAAEYNPFITNTMCEQAADTSAMKKLYDLGYLPLRIRAVDEGTRVNIGTPMFEITNTVKGFAWLVNYLETYLSDNIWLGMTSATTAFRYRELVNEYYEKTVDDGAADPAAACGDFSMRGMTAPTAAYHSSAGHLLSFTGTATIGSIAWLKHYYGADPAEMVVGRGVPSTEHSVMSSYGREGEFECYRHIIEDVMKTGPISIVSDTYDYWNVLTNYLPRLKDSIMNRDGKVIIRGDSGDPVDIICGELDAKDYMVVEGLTEEGITEYFKKKAEEDYKWNDAHETCYRVRIGDYRYRVSCDHAWVADKEDDSEVDGYYSADVEYVHYDKFLLTPASKGTVELLWDVFGGTINSKGYKVLDPHIGAIYGDSITYDRAKAIYERLEAKGFAVSNVTLGIGSYTYQYVTRDTFGFALKATHAVVDGEERFIFKDPVTDKIAGNNFKKSQRGLCYVYRDGDDIRYKDGLTLEEYNSEEYADNLLHTVFEDGVFVSKPTLTEIRDRLHEKTGGFSWVNRKVV